MAFSAPQEDAPEKEAAVLDVQTPPSGKQDQPAIPERLLDDSHMNEELGINEFTAPSIRKIFEDLEGLPEIPEKVALRARPERPPMDRCSLALQLGGMMADGFVIVQCGKMNEVKPIALDLSSYAKAIGAGERVNRHAASLLKNAEDGDLSSFKNNLALIQSDVEQELASLRDSDMANLIGLGAGYAPWTPLRRLWITNCGGQGESHFPAGCPGIFSLYSGRGGAGNEGTPGHCQNHEPSDGLAGADDAGSGRQTRQGRRGSHPQNDAGVAQGGSGPCGIIIPLSGRHTSMVLPLLTSLEVRLTPRSLYLRNEKLERMVRDDGRIPVPYNVSIRNAGDGAVRIIGKKWTVRSHGDGTQIIEGDELFGSRPCCAKGRFLRSTAFRCCGCRRASS
ncbi:hypothetical protein M5E88_16400 [Akkermansia muciniphila]|nr:hypothetical protein M5E88_16400 [Akkermansia muciniphila]